MTAKQEPYCASHHDIDPDAQSTTSLAKPTPDQTAVAPAQTTSPPLLHTAIEEDSDILSELNFGKTSADDTVSDLNFGRASFLTAGPSCSSLDSSFDDERIEPVSSRRSVRRDNSNLKFRPARRSGSLPPMDSVMANVPKLSLEEGREGETPPSPPPPPLPVSRLTSMESSWVLCSEHHMSMSSRLPPIGCVSDLQSPRSLPKNTPREIMREVSVIDPTLIDNTDPTEVRMKGRRRNALMTPQPPTPDIDS
ncbi:hypothetical protein ACOMHN_015475 [Nucella lapillus]